MERTSDFEQLLFLYKTEGKVISLEQFCIIFGMSTRISSLFLRMKYKRSQYIM